MSSTLNFEFGSVLFSWGFSFWILDINLMPDTAFEISFPKYLSYFALQRLSPYSVILSRNVIVWCSSVCFGWDFFNLEFGVKSKNKFATNTVQEVFFSCVMTLGVTFNSFLHFEQLLPMYYLILKFTNPLQTLFLPLLCLYWNRNFLHSVSLPTIFSE